MNNPKGSQNLFRHIDPMNEHVTRVAYTHTQEAPGFSLLIAEDFKPERVAAPIYRNAGDSILFQNRQGEVILKETARGLTEKELFRYVVDGEPIVKSRQTANGEVTYIENSRQEPNGTAYEGTLVFEVTEDERIFGLGQHEDGVFNYNERKEYLYQTNMKISIPLILSSRNYAILIDTETAAVFDAKNGEITFTLDTVNELCYYVIIGDSFDEIIGVLRGLTGNAPMLPRWAYGYVQSKERYESSEELIDTVGKFRESGIPIDCIVQDWLSWEEGLWGEKRADPKRFPNLRELVDRLHENHVKLMVSVWPNMTKGGSNLREFEEKGLLLPNSTTYDAFREEARALYWKQCNEDWFSAGADAWWCDNAEPFSDADWNGETRRPEELRYQIITEDSQKSMDWTRLNTYGLLHAKGIYEHWRQSNSEKRVTNLTRSSYISGQRYGVISWSGDICAKWSTLRNQIAEGIKASISGMPYWTLDIGGFFTVKDKWENRGCGKAGDQNPLWFWNGDFNDGVADLGYRELYVRWLQYGVFLPMFRAHGTDTPREPWRLGKPGEIFYDTLLKYIHLRYQLLPYIYATAAGVCQRQDTMLRSLMFDFAEDEKVRDICDSYMFGRAILVAPVTEPMYYGVNSVALSHTEKTRRVYLPRSAHWYDFWTNKAYAGGQTLCCEAPLEKIPLFIRAGSILPVSQPIQYADEKNGEIAEIWVYGGADGAFTLYNDEGDNYSYEKGNFSAIPLTYRHDDTTLTFGRAQGQFKYQERFVVKRIGDGQILHTSVAGYRGEETTLRLA